MSPVIDRDGIVVPFRDLCPCSDFFGHSGNGRVYPQYAVRRLYRGFEKRGGFTQYGADASGLVVENAG